MEKYILIVIFLLLPICCYAQPIMISKLFEDKNIIVVDMKYIPSAEIQPEGECLCIEETEPSFNSNWTYINSKPNSTSNATYDALVSDNESWNEPLADAKYYPLGSNPSGFYNESNPFGYYNASTVLNNISINHPHSLTKTNISDLGYVSNANISTTTCGGTDKVSSINNATGIVTCSSDQMGSGSGTSFTQYNYTTYDVTANNITFWNNTLRLSVSANKVIEIECELFTKANATTTGVQFNSSITGVNNSIMVMRYFTTATAIAICNNEKQSTMSCNSTASAGTVITPTEFYLWATTTSTGQFSIDMRSELNGPQTVRSANVTKGSWCRSVEK